MSLLNLAKFVATHPLTKNHKLETLLRFAQWQIGSRLAPGAVVYEWVKGAKFIVRTGDTGFTMNIYTGLQDFSDMAFVLHVLRDCDFFIDVGANVGSYTILACAAIGARGYAFEPVPGTCQRLRENILLNHLENRVQCLNIGIGREQGSMHFTSSLGATNHALAMGERPDNAVSVAVSTLDAVLRDETPAIVKIDVEGFETPVLEGALATLKKRTLHSVIIELNGSGRRYGFDESTILGIMFDHGFKAYSYDPMDRVLIDLHGKNLN